MSEIQSIAQNNYILHNIDAKKLYVQEPLFTANSGDAVYVGWRPDETVLWSGNSGQVTASMLLTVPLSEPASAFEKIQIKCNCSYGAGTVIQTYSYNDSSENNIYPITLAGGNAEGNTLYIDKGYVKFSGSSAIFGGGSRFNFMSPTSGNLNTNRGPIPIEIRGINRKENA